MEIKPKKTHVWTRLRNWMRHHHTATYAIAGVGLIVTAGVVALALLYQKPVETPPVAVVPEQKAPEPTVYYSPLTGEKVKNEAATHMAVTAIMIENSPSARPQSGLKAAGVVYEAIAEGGITRFLALYQQAKPQLIGPVRSVRMYFVDWLAPYNASVAHVGGSAAALREVRNGHYRDIDQFFNAGAYWRASDRYAPHNMYTNFKRLDALNKAKGYTTSKFKGFARTDGKPAAKPTASKVTINFSSPTYNTFYTYDKKRNRYNRFMAGVPHKDRKKGQITPSVVIALHVDETTVFEDGYRQAIKTTGTGKATIFQNGTAQNVTWHKADRQSQLKFTDKNGEIVPLTRGQTWIAAVPNGKGSVSWQ